MDNNSKIWTTNFFKLCFVNLFTFITFYSLLTTLPLYVINEYNGTEFLAGLISTLIFASAIIIRLFIGEIIAKYGLRKVLIISSISFFLISIGYIYSQGILTLLILRFLHGFSFGALTTVLSIIVMGILPEERKGEGFSYFLIFTNLAVIIGPFLGFLLIQHLSFTLLFYIINIFVLLSSIICYLIKGIKDEVLDKPHKQKYTIFSINRYLEKKAIPISMIGFLISFCYASILSFISIHLSNLGLSNITGYFFFFLAITMILVRPILGRLFDRYGGFPIILPCILTFGLSLFILSNTHNIFVIMTSACLIGIGYGSLFPFLMTLSVKSIPRNRASYAISTFQSLFDLGLAFGSFSLGYFISLVGFNTLYLLLSIFLLFVAGLYYVFYIRIEKEYSKIY